MIITSIDRFIDSRIYHYALLINGKWGCGKTYFITKELIPHLQGRDKKVTYLSLYGLESTDKINEKLSIEALKGSDAIKKIIDTKGGQIATSILSSALNTVLEHFEIKDIKEVISQIPSYDVVIFDDLERCSCDISEVMGYINNFVEHSNASVILVANEEEIGKWQLDRNPELQMMIAIDPRVDVEISPTAKEAIESSLYNGSNLPKETMMPFTLEQIEQRRKALFCNNEKYKRIKEKVIGQTINYDPDLKTIFSKLIIESFESNEALKNRILSMIDRFVGVAEKEGHNNIRTFQFFLEKTATIYRIIGNDYEEVEETILFYTYRRAVCYMKGLPTPKWECDYGEQEFDEYIMFANHVMGFRFIDELIETDIIDDDYVRGVLDQYSRIAAQKGKLGDDPYTKIVNWRFAEDAQLKEWLEEIADNIKSKKYSSALYTYLLGYIAGFYDKKIMVDQCDKILEAMKEYIASTENPDPLEREHLFLESQAVADKYNALRAEIEGLINAARKDSEKHIFEKIITEDDWANKLCEIASNKGYVEGRSFIYWLETDALLEKIKTANNEQIHQFRLALQCYYDKSVYYEYKANDYDRLAALRKGLDALPSFGQIKTVCLNWLKNDLDEYMKGIRPE